MAYILKVSPYAGEGTQIFDKAEKLLPDLPQGETEQLKYLNAVGLSPDFSWKPVSEGDVSRYITADMQSDAGMVSFARAGGAILATAGWFGGPILKGVTGLANLAINAGLDYSYYKTARQVAENPDAFWSSYINNVDEIKKDGITTSFMEQFATASSYGASGGEASLYQKEGMKGGHPIASEVLGMLYRDFSAMNIGMGLGSSAVANTGWVVSSGMANGIQHYRESVGMGESPEVAMRGAYGVGIAAGATGAAFMGILPYAIKAGTSKVLNGSVGTMWEQLISPDKFIGSTVWTGAQAAGWVTTDNALKNAWLGKPQEFDAMTMGISFGLGAALGAAVKMPNLFSKAKAIDDAVAPIAEPVKLDTTLSADRLHDIAQKAPSKADFNLQYGIPAEDMARLMARSEGVESRSNVRAITEVLQESYPNYNGRMGEWQNLMKPVPLQQAEIAANPLVQSARAASLAKPFTPADYVIEGKTFRWKKGAVRELDAIKNDGKRGQLVTTIQSMIDNGEWKSREIDGMAVRLAKQKTGIK